MIGVSLKDDIDSEQVYSDAPTDYRQQTVSEQSAADIALTIMDCFQTI